MTRPRTPAPTGRRIMDIEDALAWAFRDELPKQREEGARGEAYASSVSPMFRLAALGGRVDNWSREPGFPAALGDPHPDALTIQAAVNGLEAYRDCSFDGPLELADDLPISVDEPAAFARALPSMIGLVMSCAKLGSRPSWDGQPTPEPVRAANGRPLVLRDVTQMVPIRFDKRGRPTEKRAETVTIPCPAEKKGTYPQGAFSPLRWVPGPAEIVRDRARYLVWRTALEVLAGELQGTLQSIGILPPSAPMRPWAGEQELGKGGKVLESHAGAYRPQEARQADADRRFARRRRPTGQQLREERRQGIVSRYCGAA